MPHGTVPTSFKHHERVMRKLLIAGDFRPHDFHLKRGIAGANRARRENTAARADGARRRRTGLCADRCAPPRSRNRSSAGSVSPPSMRTSPLLNPYGASSPRNSTCARPSSRERRRSWFAEPCRSAPARHSLARFDALIGRAETRDGRLHADFLGIENARAARPRFRRPSSSPACRSDEAPASSMRIEPQIGESRRHRRFLQIARQMHFERHMRGFGKRAHVARQFSEGRPAVARLNRLDGGAQLGGIGNELRQRLHLAAERDHLRLVAGLQARDQR